MGTLDRNAPKDIVVVSNDGQGAKFMRGIHFWRDEIEIPKIQQGLQRISDAVAACRLPIYPPTLTAAAFSTRLDMVGEAAFAAGVDGRIPHCVIHHDLQSVDAHIITPFASFLRKGADEIDRAGSMLRKYVLVRGIANDGIRGSDVTIRMLDEAAEQILSRIGNAQPIPLPMFSHGKQHLRSPHKD